jgi:hypothetical protein
MKAFFKNLCLCVSLCLLASSGFAQIPNPSFEEINANGSLRNWGNIYLQSVWFDTTGEMQGDSIIYDNAYYSATSDAHNGNSQNTGTAGAIIADLDSVYSAWGSFETIPVQDYPSALVKFSNFYTEAPGVRQPSLGSSFIVDDVQLYTTTGFDLISRKQLDVVVYPNPSSDLITIRRNTSEMAQVNIYQLNGQLLKQETICNDVSEIDLRDFSNGAYLLEVISDGKTWTQQLIIQH